MEKKFFFLLCIYLSSLSYSITGHIFWLSMLMILLCTAPVRVSFLGCLLAKLFMISLPEYKEITAHCEQYKCNENFVLPFSQIRINIDSNKSIDNALLKIRRVNSNNFLPLIHYKVSEIKSFTLTEKDRPKKRDFQAYPTLIFEGLKKENALSKLFLDGGWAHYFCFSGWHAQLFYKVTRKRKVIFLLLSFLISVLLDFSFPFIRSVLEVFLKNKIYSWIVSLCLLPYAPLTLSFWLCCYFQIILTITQPSHLTWTLTSMALSQLLTGRVNLFIFLIFQQFSEKVAMFIFFFFLLSYLAAFFSAPYNLVLTLDKVFQIIAENILLLLSFEIQINEVVCWGILFAAALNIKVSFLEFKKGEKLKAFKEINM